MPTKKRHIFVHLAGPKSRGRFPSRPADVVGYHDYNYYILTPCGSGFRCFVFHRSHLVHTSRHGNIFDAEKRAKAIIDQKRGLPAVESRSA